MAALTDAIPLPANTWTPITVARRDVLARLRKTGTVFLVAAETAPAFTPDLDATFGSTMKFMTWNSGTPFSASFRDTTTNVYCYPAAGSTNVVEVISE